MYFLFGFHSSLLLIFFFHGWCMPLVLQEICKRKHAFQTGGLPSSPAVVLPLHSALDARFRWMVWYTTLPRHIILYPLSAFIFTLGLLYFLYAKPVESIFPFQQKEWIHFLPAVMYIIFSAVMLITDKIVLKKYFFLADGEDPDFDWWYQYLDLYLCSFTLLQVFVITTYTGRWSFRRWVMQTLYFSNG